MKLCVGPLKVTVGRLAQKAKLIVATDFSLSAGISADMDGVNRLDEKPKNVLVTLVSTRGCYSAPS